MVWKLSTEEEEAEGREPRRSRVGVVSINEGCSLAESFLFALFEPVSRANELIPNLDRVEKKVAWINLFNRENICAK